MLEDDVITYMVKKKQKYCFIIVLLFWGYFLTALGFLKHASWSF